MGSRGGRMRAGRCGRGCRWTGTRRRVCTGICWRCFRRWTWWWRGRGMARCLCRKRGCWGGSWGRCGTDGRGPHRRDGQGEQACAEGEGGEVGEPMGEGGAVVEVVVAVVEGVEETGDEGNDDEGAVAAE